MKFCLVIPCFNHGATVGAVAQAALAHAPVFVVDDGSTAPLPDLPGCTVLRLAQNSGKGAALRAGFQQAAAAGYTHAITMDADGQHFAADVAKVMEKARTQPEALVVGQRDLRAAGAPPGRRGSNAVSSFCFQVESGRRLKDTQCGFRCYPLALARRLRARSERFAFELELMVRMAWMGAPIVPVPVRCVYRPEHLRQSHFRPVADLARLALLNAGLVLQSWFVPRAVRRARSLGEQAGHGR